MSLRDRKRAETRQRILDTCGHLFRTVGFDQTTIDHIVARVGISRQTFFNYFAGKEAVLTELGLAWLREQAEAPKIGPRSAGGSILAGTRRAIRAQIESIEADADFMRVVFTRSGLLFPQAAPIDGESERIRTDHTRRLFEGLGMVMRAAQQAGEVRSDIEPLQAAELYVSVMLMTIRFWLIDYWRDGMGLGERAMRALDVIERGLAPLGPPDSSAP